MVEADANGIEEKVRAEMEEAVRLLWPARSRRPEMRSIVYGVGGTSHGQGNDVREAVATAIIEEDAARSERHLLRTKTWDDRARSNAEDVRKGPHSDYANFGNRRTGHGDWAAMTGLRPIVELWMSEFMLVAFDQVDHEAPRLRYMSGGQVKVPVVFKAGYGLPPDGLDSTRIARTTWSWDARFGRSLCPRHRQDAKGLMKAAIRDDNPVIFLQHFLLTLEKEKCRTAMSHPVRAWRM